MNEDSLSLSISIFQDQSKKDQAVQMIQGLHKDKARKLTAIVIDKDENSQIHYKDIGMSPKKGALSGLAIGAVIGILSGGVGLILGALGGMLGSLVGSKKYQDTFSEVRLHEVVGNMKPGSSAIVAVIQTESLPELEKNMTAYDAETFNAALSDDLAEKFEQSGIQAEDQDWLDQIEE